MSVEYDKKLNCRLWAPMLQSGVPGPEAYLRLLERLFPPHKLRWTLNRKAQPVRIKNREHWVFERLFRGDPVLLCNAMEENAVIFHLHWSFLCEDMRQVTAYSLDVPGRDEFYPNSYPLVLQGGDTVDAYWGTLLPRRAAGQIGYQIVHDDSSQPIPFDLPALTWKVPSPSIPLEIGWINYWGPEACQILGIEDPETLVPPFFRAERTPRGGIVAQLTEEPLVLENETHLAALRAAYERLPAVGRG